MSQPDILDRCLMIVERLCPYLVGAVLLLALAGMLSAQEYYSVRRGGWRRESAAVENQIDYWFIDTFDYATAAICSNNYVSSDTTNLKVFSENTIKTQGTNSMRFDAYGSGAVDNTLTHSITATNISMYSDIIFDLYAQKTGNVIEVSIYDYGIGKSYYDMTTNMSGVTTPPPVVVSASSNVSGYDPYKAFDGLTNTSGWMGGPGALPWTLIYDFGTNVTKVVEKYTITSPSSTWAARAPRDWAIYGSNADGLASVQLDFKGAQYNWGNNEERSFYFTNSTAYRYYFITISRVNGDSYCWINEMRWHGQTSGLIRTPLTYIPNVAASNEWVTYNFKLGSNTYNSTSNYYMYSDTSPPPKVASASSSYEGRPAYLLFDGIYVGSIGWTDNGGGGSAWVKYDYGTNTTATLTAYEIIGSSILPQRSPRDWKLYGSNVGSTQVLLDIVSLQTNWSANQVRYYSLTNTSAYRYYIMNISTNNGDPYTQFQEWRHTESNTVAVTTNEYDNVDQVVVKIKAVTGTNTHYIDALMVTNLVTR